MEDFYLDHRSRPIFRTKYWQCTIWLVADEKRLNDVEYVRYFLHPTFHSEYTESRDLSTGFRTILDCWGSFYIKASIFFRSGHRENIEYFLDHEQFYPRKRKPTIKMLSDKDINEKEFVENIDQKVRLFQRVNVSKTIQEDISGRTIIGIRCEKSRFESISFRGVDLSGSLFTDCEFLECDFTLAKSEESQYINCDFSGSILHPKLFLSCIVENVSASGIRLPDNRSELIQFDEMKFEKWINNLKQEVNDMISTRPSPKVFLCHANEDKERIRALYKALRKHGLDAWFDKNLVVGDDWEKEIINAIKNSDFFAICLSKIAVEKRGFIHSEIRIAVKEYQIRPHGTIFLLPIRLEECEIPNIDLDANKKLTDLHWIDIFQGDEKAEKNLADSIWMQWKKKKSELFT